MQNRAQVCFEVITYYQSRQMRKVVSSSIQHPAIPCENSRCPGPWIRVLVPSRYYYYYCIVGWKTPALSSIMLVMIPALALKPNVRAYRDVKVRNWWTLSLSLSLREVSRGSTVSARSSNCPLANGARPLVSGHLEINHMRTQFLRTNGRRGEYSRS